MKSFGKLIITFGILFVIFYNIDFQILFDSINKFNLLSYFLILSIYSLSQIIYSFKWYVILKQKCSFLVLFRLNFISFFYSTFLPGQIAGDVAKGWKLSKIHPNKGEIVMSVIFDRITGLIGLIIAGIIGIILSESEYIFNLKIPLIIISVIILIFFIITSRSESYDFLLYLTNKIHKKVGFDGFFTKFVTLLEFCNKEKMGLIIILYTSFLGFIFQVVNVCLIYLVSEVLSLHVSFFDWLWIFTVISLTVILPVTIGGIGLREAGFIGLLSLFNIASEEALIVSTMVFALNILGAIIGFIFENIGFENLSCNKEEFNEYTL